MNESQILLFVLTSLAIISIPGQDMVLVMSKGMTHGAKAAIITTAGICVGLLGHTILSALGLGVLLMSSEAAFLILKYIGAMYLLYLGIRLIINTPTPLEVKNTPSKPVNTLFGKLFMEGLACNISNPKIIIFYFAFLPQFISTDIENPSTYLIVLGISYALLTFLIKSLIGFFAGAASLWVRSRPIVIKLINRISGTLLIGLGINTYIVANVISFIIIHHENKIIPLPNH